MTVKFQPRHTDEQARIRQLEARCERLARLLDECWTLAVEGLGDEYLEDPENVDTDKFDKSLVRIAETAAAALNVVPVVARV